MSNLELILITFLLGAIYPLVGYPLLLSVIAKLYPQPVARGPCALRVSVLIPACNEEDCIGDTLESMLRQDYSHELLEILVVSDGSTDATDQIVARYAHRGVRLIRRPIREGKAAALNEAARLTRGDVLVFSDANSLFAPDAVRKLVENFADPRVGYVTGSLEYVAAREVTGLGGRAYMRYENWLRRIETRAGSVIGVNGGVDAMRRSLYLDVPPDQITDLVLPLRVIASGYRVVFDDRVHSRETANAELASEFRMRVRVALRALRGIAYVPEVLNAVRFPLSAFCILSHKVLRYLSFAFLVGALLVNCLLIGESYIGRVLLGCQLVFYVLAGLGLQRRLPRLLRSLTVLPTYFVMSNTAFAVAALRFARGDVVATWRPRTG
jgi:cellulose synthase/poly-beta-1,6-N-acetylglucosamine synthase-like glycosyltransferase